jgi:hypothetical protein
MRTLRERLRDWQDCDVAEYELGVTLGLWPEWGGGPPEEDPWHGHKGVFWAANPLGTMLHETLVGLAKLGMLESREAGLEFRWNPSWSPASS